MLLHTIIPPPPNVCQHSRLAQGPHVHCSSTAWVSDIGANRRNGGQFCRPLMRAQIRCLQSDLDSKTAVGHFLLQLCRIRPWDAQLWLSSCLENRWSTGSLQTMQQRLVSPSHICTFLTNITPYIREIKNTLSTLPNYCFKWKKKQKKQSFVLFVACQDDSSLHLWFLRVSWSCKGAVVSIFKSIQPAIHQSSEPPS